MGRFSGATSEADIWPAHTRTDMHKLVPTHVLPHAQNLKIQSCGLQVLSQFGLQSKTLFQRPAEVEVMDGPVGKMMAV